MFKLTLRSVVAIVCVVSLILLWAITDVSTAQSPAATPNESQRLATQIGGGATQTREALSTIVGTPVPPAEKTMTATTMNATRTAIAVTREPYLLTPSTPTNIELTATALMSEYEQRYQTSNANTLAPVELTALWATHAAVTPHLVCVPSLVSSGDVHWQEVIDFALKDRGVEVIFVRVAVDGIGEDPRCNHPFYPLRMKIFAQVKAEDMTDEALAALTATILEVLSHFPALQTYSSKPVTLFINYFKEHKEGYSQNRIIHTNYANALAAYAENLRGAALLEALGGLMDSGY